VDQTAAIKEWVGRTRKEEDEVSLGAVRRLAATLDQDPQAFHAGRELPESWYAILFGPTARESALGPDGHPLTGDFLPPLHNTRRMFAGRRVRFHQPLRVGDQVVRISTVSKAQPKSGRSGPFTLMTVTHELSSGAGAAITEEQDLVYRAQASASEADTAATSSSSSRRRQVAPDPEKPEWSHPFTPDPVLLFRYSALTFNAHRIHYDLRYAREQEGYPALVVNGGLTALLLVETARAHLPGAIASYSARAMHPLFIGQTIVLNGRRSDEGAELWACDPDGRRAYQVNVAVERRQP
jgi:3-methylfumaryl-CoA hydratase